LYGQKRFLQRQYGKIAVSKISSIVDFLEAGIKAEGLRQKAITNNVANLQTPGYRRIDVRFEQLLAKALDSNGAADLDEIEPDVYQPRQTPVNSNGNDVSLETEVGEMVKNTLRHRAYVGLLKKNYQQIETAINVR
jgi:flagellar basal-body rod protein FlgB